MSFCNSLTFFRIWTSAQTQPISNVIWQSHRVHLVNISVYAKLHHTIPLSSRIWSTAKPRPMKNVISQSFGLHLASINVYATIHQNIPLSFRDRAIFTFFQNLALGKASTDDKCHFAIPWARSCQYQCVCKLLSKYSKWFKLNFTVFRIWTSAKPRQIPKFSVNWLSHGLHHVNINVYAKFYHNIPLRIRIRIVYWWNAETTITHQDLWLGN